MPVPQRKCGRAVALDFDLRQMAEKRELLCHSLRDASSYLLSFGDSPAGDDDDFVLLVKCHNFRHTVRGTGMVNVPRQWDKVRDAEQLGWMALVPCWPTPRMPPLGTLKSLLTHPSLTWQGLRST